MEAAAAQIPWRPLGRLLVEKGLLSYEQLERALEEQARSGRRLGEILIELDCVTHSALSLALAEQYGFELTVETGFGTGLRAQLERRHDRNGEGGNSVHLQVSDGLPAPLREVNVPEPELEEVADDLHLAQLEEQWAKLAAAEEQLAETERELATARRRGTRRHAQAARLIERVRQRERRIAELSLPEHELAPVDATRGHLVFVQLAHRYELVERDGAPPEPNVLLELPELGDGRFVVARVGRSPLPNDTRQCAFAQQLHEPRD